ncbi:MAG: hypothetical protein V4714_04885 [Bacteroidota bacterium]
MRVIADIPHPHCKITLFAWNSKFIIKIEMGMLEQTYKVSELDVSVEEDVKKLLDSEFMNTVLKRFSEMDSALYEAIERL